MSIFFTDIKKKYQFANLSRQLLIVASIISLFIAFYIYFVAAPKLTGFDKNYSYSANVVSQDNFYDNSQKQYLGKQFSVTTFSYSVVDEKNGNLLVKNIFDVKNTNGDPIFNVERTYGINPKTGQHVQGLGDHDRTGYLFAPKHLHKHDFTYWHINYDEPAPMRFSREERVNGLKVYLYESNYHADQTNNLTHLPDVGKTKGINLDIHLKLWIDPISGRLINYQDDTTAYYYDLATKERLYPWNKFTNTFNQDSVNEQVDLAKAQDNLMNIYEMYLPGAFILLSIIFLAVCLRRRIPSVKNYLYYLIPLLFLLLSVVLFFESQSILYRQKNNIFTQDSLAITNAISERIDIYKNVLEGVKGLFTASQSVDRSEFKQYVQTLNIQRTYPGIQGIGFAKFFPASQLNEVTQSTRKDGYPDFKVFPEATRSAYTSIIYLEPLDARNKRAFGFDMTTEPTRKNAMDTARDTGLPTLTQKVTLLQEDGKNPQAGTLLYIPVYQNGQPTQTLEERRKFLEGYVYSPFRMADLMDNILSTIPDSVKKGIDIEVYDGVNDISDKTELFDHDAGKYSKDDSYTASFKKSQTIFVQGHPWTLRFVSTPDFARDEVAEFLPYSILLGGFVFSISITILIYSLASAKKNAEKTAATTTIKDEAVLASISEGLIITDQNGIITGINDETIKILGFEKTELLGKKMAEVAQLQDENGAAIPDNKRPIILALSKQEVTKISLGDAVYYLRKDGQRIPITLNVSPVILNKQVIGAVEVFQDVSKERQLEKAKDEFLSVASHELRTPMTAIKGLVSMIIDGDYGKVNSDINEPLHDVYSSTERLIHLVNDMLNVSRIEAGRLKFTLAEFKINEPIEEIVKLLSIVSKNKGTNLKVGTINDVTVLGDLDKVKQILNNLIGNAIKFTDKGSVMVSTVIENEFVKISVSDTGIGISSDDQKNIFGKFEQISSAQNGKPEGTGLGLYITKELVEKMGGKLWLEKSQPNVGSVFSFTLPLASSAVAKKVENTIIQEAKIHPDQK